MDQLKKEGFAPVLIGDGKTVDTQYPESGSKLTKGSVVLLKTEGETILPDFTGWSKKTVLSFKMLSGLDIRITGDGYVTGQSHSKGIVIGSGEPIAITLQPPSEIYKAKEKKKDK